MRVRTGYSFKTAVGHLPDVMKRLAEIKFHAAPISDRLSTFGFARWDKECQKADVKPIFGVEIAVVASLNAKKPIVDYWTFFAKTDLVAIHNLIYKSTKQSAKEPALNYKDAMQASGVIKIAGERVIVSELEKYNVAKYTNDFYISLSPSTPRGLVEEAKDKYKFIATSDNVYPRKEDVTFYEAALGGKAQQQTYARHLLSVEEWREAVEFISTKKLQDIALRNQEKAMASCNARLKKAELYVPEKKKTLLQMCKEGAKSKGVDLTNKVYKERLERELALIAEKKFEDYFYIIADMVTWAKKRMIVGPARGSSCGSLVCYLLSITEIDPIPYGLIFERFIDINRLDLPDIDIDFSDKRREAVFEYAEQRFGRENIARLGTVGLFKSRAALKQISRSLWIPDWMTDKVAESTLKRSSGDSRAMDTLADALKDTPAGQELIKKFPEAEIVTRLEGHPNNASQHAAGICVTKKPIINYVAIDARTRSVMCDKKDAEGYNLLKIDALGLTQLSIFENIARRIGKPDRSGWLEKIPLNDQKAFDVLNRGEYAGIFQFQGIALQSIASQIQINNLEDIVSITALARPGPLAAGGTHSWVKRRRGEEPITTEHPMLTELTKDTYGIVVYQETVMQIARKIGKLSWEDTSELRKAMSKSMGDEFFAKYKNNFMKGAKENKVGQEVAERIWKNINTFGSWAFNRSHAVAYGMVSYWCCYLKAHFPLEFAAASLDAESDPAKQLLFLRELEREGIKYKPIDPKHSTDKWEIEEGLLVGPLTSVKGIGPATMVEILEARKNGEELRPAVLKKLERAETEIDSLYPIADAIKKNHPDLSAINILSSPVSIESVQPGMRGDVMVFGVAEKIASRNLNDAQNVQKRGKRLPLINGEDPMALNIFLSDDTDRILCRIGMKEYHKLAPEVINRGKAGKALYAIKGKVPSDFRMIAVTNIRYLGDLKEAKVQKHDDEANSDDN